MGIFGLKINHLANPDAQIEQQRQQHSLWQRTVAAESRIRGR
jgi:hypothetical protein